MNQLLPKGTFSGYHQSVGELAEADCLLALEFSHRPAHLFVGRLDNGPLPVGQPNIEIAECVKTAQSELSLPVFASRSVERALRQIDSGVVVTETFEGSSAKGARENTGTWGELMQADGMMKEYGCRRPAIYTSGYNVGNVLFQARKLGMNAIVPADLPRSFDRKSDQLWTRHRLAWVALTGPRLGMLRARGH